ncbi:MAG: HPr family phosphocarrier protein [Anaerostipes sp.]|jgi:phosphotransferase system HPr (HPr) family protein|nr:HPr family phosphocarrier protein [Anaerostipes sp.]MDD3745888.1 HPr family phosphocarrier protein [Anaerostipes sp.]
MITFSHKIQSTSGLHAMPCVNIVACVIHHKSSVRLQCNSQEVDGTDPIKLMSLGGMKDDVLDFSIEGPDEKEVYETLLRICHSVL